MALIEETLFGTVDKVQIAIDTYRAFEPKEGFYIAYSGGKDSDVILELAKMAGVKFDAHYSVTSVDFPEVVRFIKSEHPEVSRDLPRDENGDIVTMWNLIPKKLMPPTRVARYCCEMLKESSGIGRVTVTGVRWSESTKRKNNQHLIIVNSNSKKKKIVFNDENDESRRVVEQCYRTKKTLFNPIISWTDDDVWEFHKKYCVSYCKKYDEGYERLGCIGCPLSSNAEKELNENPKYKQAYIRAFDRMLLEREKLGKKTKWKTGEEVMDWWLHGGRESGELTLWDLEETEDEDENG